MRLPPREMRFDHADLRVPMQQVRAGVGVPGKGRRRQPARLPPVRRPKDGQAPLHLQRQEFVGVAAPKLLGLPHGPLPPVVTARRTRPAPPGDTAPGRRCAGGASPARLANLAPRNLRCNRCVRASAPRPSQPTDHAGRRHRPSSGHRSSRRSFDPPARPGESGQRAKRERQRCPN